MKKIHIICNPVAGKGGTVLLYRRLRSWADSRKDIKLELHMTASASHATEITQKLTNTNEDILICAMGGDGTVNEVVNGIVNFDKTTLAVLPFGSGNDFVYSLGLNDKVDPVELLQSYVDNPQVKKIDYIEINDKYRAINSVGLGMSAEVIKCRNKMKHFKPKTQYMIATIRKSFFWKKFNYIASFDNKPEEEIKTLWLCANNGQRIGGKIVCCPHAKLDDGYIAVTYVKCFNRLKTLPILSIISKEGGIKNLHHAFFTKCKELTITLNDNCIEYDGNLLDHLNALHLKLIPGKIKILVPTESKHIDERNKKTAL